MFLIVRTRKHFNTVSIDLITKAGVLEVGGYDEKERRLETLSDNFISLVKQSGQSILKGG